MGETFDLASLFERDDVKRPDGSKLLIRHKQELSIMQRHQLDALISEINELDGKDGKTEQDAERGSVLLHDLAGIVVVDAPDDLEDWECASIFAFWLTRSFREAELPPSKPRAKRSAKPSSSRGSKRSTAATRKSGSTPRRSS